MTAFLTLWHTVMTTSSRHEDGYTWAVIALGHIMLGAALAGAVSGVGYSFPLLVRLSVSVIYWMTKEYRDIRQGGGLIDSISDTAWVGYGLLYVGPFWWPLAALVVIGIGGVLKQKKVEDAR